MEVQLVGRNRWSWNRTQGLAPPQAITEGRHGHTATFFTAPGRKGHPNASTEDV